MGDFHRNTGLRRLTRASTAPSHREVRGPGGPPRSYWLWSSRVLSSTLPWTSLARSFSAGPSAWRWTHLFGNGSPRRGLGRWTSPPQGKPRGPIALIVTQLRSLGWEPTEPGVWHHGGEPKSFRDLEGLRSHLDHALALSRWEGLAARRNDFAGAEDGIDEEASFRGPRKALDAKRNTTFGKYACILSGGAWTRGRRSRASFDVDRAAPCAKTPNHQGDPPPPVVAVSEMGRPPKPGEQEIGYPRGCHGLAAEVLVGARAPACAGSGRLPPHPPQGGRLWQAEAVSAPG